MRTMFSDGRFNEMGAFSRTGWGLLEPAPEKTGSGFAESGWGLLTRVPRAASPQYSKVLFGAGPRSALGFDGFPALPSIPAPSLAPSPGGSPPPPAPPAPQVGPSMTFPFLFPVAAEIPACYKCGAEPPALMTPSIAAARGCVPADPASCAAPAAPAAAAPPAPATQTALLVGGGIVALALVWTLLS